MAETLAQLRQRVQTLFDVSGSGVLTSTELDQLINDAYRSLWADVTSANRTFRVTIDTFTIATGQTRALPADYKDTVYVRMNPNTDQMVYLGRFPAKSGAQMSTRTYRLQGSSLIIEPLNRAPGSYDHLYVPQCPVLTNVGDTLDVELDQFKDYIAMHAAMVALSREESDAGQIASLFAEVKGRATKWAASQRSADPIQIEDVRGYTSRAFTP